MLGYLRGRVYYNLLNWYRALALLPGYSFNRAFMERMMGVRQKLEDPPDAPYATGKARDLVRLVRMVCRLLREQHRLPGEVRRFHARVDAALRPYETTAALDELSIDALAALYLRLERELLREWRAPLVNDFLAMIYFGVLGRLVEKWLPGAPPTLVNDLLIGQKGIISTEPAERIRAFAQQPEVVEVLNRCSVDCAAWDALLQSPAAPALQAYLNGFGDRCAGELKLETVTPRQEPWQIAGMIRRAMSTASPDGRKGDQARREAEAEVETSLSGWRRFVFRGVLSGTRERVRDRENLRFERTRVFGLTRRIFLAIGAHLVAISVV
jgi:pyruvate,water dikinase